MMSEEVKSGKKQPARSKQALKVAPLDIEALDYDSKASDMFIGRTLYERDSAISREDLDTYLNRETSHASVFYALAAKFGVATNLLPKVVADIRE